MLLAWVMLVRSHLCAATTAPVDLRGTVLLLAWVMLVRTRLCAAPALQLAWSEDDEGEHALLLQGDNNGCCPTVFVNHEAFWGCCHRRASGSPCNCAL